MDAIAKASIRNVMFNSKSIDQAMVLVYVKLRFCATIHSVATDKTGMKRETPCLLQIERSFKEIF